MHIPDGFLSPQITLPAYGISIPLWVYAVRRHFGHTAVEALPIIGACTALAFVIQTIMIPVPGGTSTHLVGVSILALIYGPLVAFVSESLVLLLQALFFGAGGVTVLGVNALAMGLIGPSIGWIAYRLLRRFSERGALFAAGYVAMQAATLFVASVLGLQHHLSANVFPVPFGVSLTAMMVPSATVAGVVEGLYTVFAITLLEKAKLRGIDR